MIPAWMKPCCCAYPAAYGIRNSTSPAFTPMISIPSVAIAAWRAKLARTRASNFASLGLNLDICHHVIGWAGITDKETYAAPKLRVFEKSDSIRQNQAARLCTKPAWRHTGLSSQIRRQMRLIGITKIRGDARETVVAERNFMQRCVETLNGCILLGTKPGALANVTLKRAGINAGRCGQRGHACCTRGLGLKRAKLPRNGSVEPRSGILDPAVQDIDEWIEFALTF